jgi:hypothetical protein
MRRGRTARGRQFAIALALVLVACREGKVRTQDTPRAGAPGWAPDEQHTYELRLNSHYGSPKDFGSPKDVSIFEFNLSATVDISPVHREGDALEFLMALRDSRLTAYQGGQKLTETGQIVADLAKPYLFVLADGRLTDSRVAPGANPLAVGIMRTLSSVMQRVEDGAGLRWEATEIDATGRYVASYERVSPQLLRKIKLRYDRWHASFSSTPGFSAATKVPRVIRSTVEVSGTEASPEQVVLDERIQTELGPGVVLESETSLMLKLRATSGIRLGDRDRAVLHAATVKLAVDEPYATAASADFDLAKAAGLSFTNIVAGLEAQAKHRAGVELRRGSSEDPVAPDDVAAGEQWMGEEARLFTALNATLRMQPNAIDQVEHLIRGRSPAWDVLISALGAAGASRGHALLLRLMDDEGLPHEVRKACGVSLIRAPAPSDVAAHGLEAKLDDTHWQRLAIYGLGTFARRQREAGNDKEAGRIVGLLASRLAVAKDARKVDLLLGISNSGSPAALDIARPFAEDPNEEIRSAALMAVRLVEDDEVDQILTSHIRSDSAKRVRLAALRAFWRRTPTEAVASLLGQVALRDPAPGVRLEAVRLMARWMPALPRLRATLQQISLSDPEKAVRSLAEHAARAEGS